MIFNETRLKGVYLIELEHLEDARGFFARTFCREEFEKHGLNPCVAQCNVSFNRRSGTLRGMHYQVPPYSEAKLITCLAGTIYDVIIDLRHDSPTYRAWEAFELCARRPQITPHSPMLYVPEGFAHGFQTLEDDTEVFYQMSTFYHPPSARGLRWNDPTFNIQWPDAERTMSEQDRNFPNFIAD